MNTAEPPAVKDPLAPPLAAHPYAGETYYDLPAVKPAPFEWMSAAYLFVSGIAAGAQMIATIARWFGAPRLRDVARNGRYLAFLGAAAGPVFLVTDLKTPHRWYNMLRIFRKTSPMSLGSYILTAFGLSSALGVLQETAVRRAPSSLPGRSLSAAADIPAAVSAAGLATYTAALLSSTSTPLWSAAPRLLGARFAASAFATGAAALSLAEHAAGRYANCATLDLIAALATAAHFGVSIVSERTYEAKGVAAALHEGRAGAANAGAMLLGSALPLACYAAGAMLGGRSARTLSMAAACGILAGGLLMRLAYHEGGKQSAKRPRDYFGMAQPRRADTANMKRLAVPSVAAPICAAEEVS